MRTKTVTVREGEWLGPVPMDWDFDAFYTNELQRGREGNPKHWEWHRRTVELYREMEAALFNGKTVLIISGGGFTHEVLNCGLYDGWPFWKPRPCIAYRGPIPGEHIEEFYNLQAVTIKDEPAPDTPPTHKPHLHAK